MDFAQTQYDVRLDWGLRGATVLAPRCEVAVIVDVLSFSTCVDIACATGTIVFPYPYKDVTAETYARGVDAVLAGNRSAGGLSLSPASMLSLNSGARLVLPSPNGATISHACSAPIVLAGCLRNAAAVARYASGHDPICVIAAGEKWPDGSLRFAWEDLVGAGALVHALDGSKSPEARAAEAVFLSVRSQLVEQLHACVSGLELVERGSSEDVILAAQQDVSHCVPRLQDGAFTQVSGEIV